MSPKQKPRAHRSGTREGPEAAPRRVNEQAGDWLSRALARSGALRLDEAEAAIKAGRVRVAGKKVTHPLAMVKSGDEVRLDGIAVDLARRPVVLMFHKPSGAVTAPKDKGDTPTVFDLLRARLPPNLRSYEWHAVGRLDRGTTGLLLFTNDEQVVTHITSPLSQLPKRYLARVFGALNESKLDLLRRGIDLGEFVARPARVSVRGPSEVEVVITEGKFHQVKRMLGAVGLPVAELHREAIGTLNLDLPEPGSWRVLSEEELRQDLGFSPVSPLP